ncbi:aspartyl-phosphate phosphatase Spo0E family protein [Halobacillus massiliensis]|uniref:aspartyl-phosphate phosphatase Spo0E family protein n=1 Tax=Halobacillus massiliensis TaxID=1926286 RepID=UPI001FEA195A|nr:aspartyl-phosphate phosphatase Spo0E family protein [Halobacillus massiliensis]
MSTERKLLNEIENCRYEMTRLTEKYSLTSKHVVYVSAKLDRLMNEYEKNRAQQPSMQKVSC